MTAAHPSTEQMLQQTWRQRRNDGDLLHQDGPAIHRAPPDYVVEGVVPAPNERCPQAPLSLHVHDNARVYGRGSTRASGTSNDTSRGR
jgi:hypothetical protein